MPEALTFGDLAAGLINSNSEGGSAGVLADFRYRKALPAAKPNVPARTGYCRT